MAKQGEILEYLAINTTENSTTLWNYRQRECAFWTEYLPTVIGYITPTYPPTTEVHSVVVSSELPKLHSIINMHLCLFSSGGNPIPRCKLHFGQCHQRALSYV